MVHTMYKHEDCISPRKALILFIKLAFKLFVYVHILRLCGVFHIFVFKR